MSVDHTPAHLRGTHRSTPSLGQVLPDRFDRHLGTLNAALGDSGVIQSTPSNPFTFGNVRLLFETP
jgi:hypothetical protein